MSSCNPESGGLQRVGALFKRTGWVMGVRMMDAYHGQSPNEVTLYVDPKMGGATEDLTFQKAESIRHQFSELTGTPWEYAPLGNTDHPVFHSKVSKGKAKTLAASLGELNLWGDEMDERLRRTLESAIVPLSPTAIALHTEVTTQRSMAALNEVRGQMPPPNNVGVDSLTETRLNRPPRGP